MIFSVALLAASLLAGVSAQSALPDVTLVPAACGTQCGAVIEVGVLCMKDYKNDTSIAACFCNGGLSSSDLSTCGSCLSSNGASSLASTLSSAGTACQQALQTCSFSCNFPTCASSDIACQCSETYLQNIYNCAACNSKNGNTGATQLSDYTALKDSCVNQNYTQTPSATQPLPSPTGQDAYVSPTLSSGAGSASASGSVAVSTSASSRSVGSVTASGSSSASRAASSGASSASSAAASATSSRASAAGPVAGQVKGVWMALAAAAVCVVGGAASLL